jgi:hypothetical protein
MLRAAGRQELAFAQCGLHRGQGRAVEIVEHLRVLQEFVARDHFLEPRLRHKMIIPPVDFIGPRRASRVGDGEAQPWFALHQRLYQAGLARTRWGRDHV